MPRRRDTHLNPLTSTPYVFALGPIDTKTCRARRTAVYGLLSGTGHADVIASDHNSHNYYSRKRYNMLYSADTKTQSFWHLI